MQRVGSSEQRGWLKVVVNIHGRDLSFWNTHLDSRSADTERLLAVEDFADWLQTETAPVIFCGDFNDTPPSEVHTLMKEAWMDGWEIVGVGSGYTIPVQAPRSRIDYIWASRNAPIQLLGAWVPYTEASDHLPVVLEFKLTNAIASPEVFHFALDEGAGSNIIDSASLLRGNFVPQTPETCWTNDSLSGRPNDCSVRFNGTFRALVRDPNELVRLDTNSGDYTLEAWVKLKPNFSPATRMILFQYEGDPGFSFSIATNRALHTTTFQKNDISSTAVVTDDDKWHHVAAVHHDKSRFDFFVDGVLAATTGYTNGPGSRTNPVITIGSAGNQVNPFIGSMDRVRFSHRALTVEELDAKSFPGPLPPLLSISKPSDGVRISWPAAFTNYALYSSSNLQNGFWTTIPERVEGDSIYLDVANEGPQRLYRLQKK